MADLTTVLDEVARRERGRIVGGLLRACGIDLAEEAFQDAVVSALEAWRHAMPANPGAWLMTAAKNRAKDAFRHRAIVARQALLVETDELDARDIDTVTDDYLRLIVTCCHPDLAPDNQIALTLKVVCGFSTDEIARAFVTTEATVSQRILRAKRAIADANIAFSMPVRDDLAARLPPVLGVIYAMFNEGHVAHTGALMRIDLQAEALRLARVVADLVPTDAETLGLVALIACSAARAQSRVDADGVPVMLDAQDRTRWDVELIREALVALQRARSLGADGPYALQAAIAAAHATAPAWEATDWRAIVDHYDALAAAAPSPIVSLNRAIALAMRDGPAAGLVALGELSRALADYHLFYAARADLLARLGKDPRPDLRKAIALATNDGERLLLQRRLRG